MQQTLRYMTKLDRAINKQKDLISLGEFYRSINISSADLFDILKKVTQFVFPFVSMGAFICIFFLLKTAPSCQDIIMDCIWLGLPEPCLDYFSFLPTDDGICCTFNGAKYNDPELNIESK